MKRFIVMIMAAITILTACKHSSPISNENRINQKVDLKMKLMTLNEKIGQILLYTTNWAVTNPALEKGYIYKIRKGNSENTFNAYTTAYTGKLQKIAVEKLKLNISLLFGYEVVQWHKRFS
ncbi:MAG: hypothetical protein P4L34_08095 [Paludibacter sp.]|nr:hypothetical protein [Paludibacter sp.]